MKQYSMLLWLYTSAAAMIWPPAWEFPHATGTSIKKKKKKAGRHRPYILHKN